VQLPSGDRLDVVEDDRVGPACDRDDQPIVIERDRQQAVPSRQYLRHEHDSRGIDLVFHY
jgi:hypothetical protein